jgi:plasmid stabilization system protein ParE
MNYLVKARARLDLQSHWRYIARDNLLAADRLLDAAEETSPAQRSVRAGARKAISYQ